MDLKWFTVGNSTTGHMGMVRETECSLNINATLENPPIRHLRQQVSWFEDHLTDRVLRVAVLGVNSEPLPVLSGVLQ